MFGLRHAKRERAAGGANAAQEEDQAANRRVIQHRQLIEVQHNAASTNDCVDDEVLQTAYSRGGRVLIGKNLFHLLHIWCASTYLHADSTT